MKKIVCSGVFRVLIYTLLKDRIGGAHIMKSPAAFLLVLAIFTGGCSWKHSTQAVRHAVDAGNIEGLDETNKFVISVPNHGGPYKDVDMLHVRVIDGPYKGQNATFYVGKSCRTDEWSVFAAMLQQVDGTWHQVEVQELEQQQVVAK